VAKNRFQSSFQGMGAEIVNAGKENSQQAPKSNEEIAVAKDNVVPMIKEEVIPKVIEDDKNKNEEQPQNDTQSLGDNAQNDDDFVIKKRTKEKTKDYMNFYLKIETIENIRKYSEETGMGQSELLDFICGKAFKKMRVKK
jgi:hypothetical protein